ncbi:MAG: hypothetical protein AAGI66_02935 [Cyanobacteria bacterium P01_H01_bin.74]
MSVAFITQNFQKVLPIAQKMLPYTPYLVPAASSAIGMAPFAFKVANPVFRLSQHYPALLLSSALFAACSNVFSTFEMPEPPGAGPHGSLGDYFSRNHFSELELLNLRQSTNNIEKNSISPNTLARLLQLEIIAADEPGFLLPSYHKRLENFLYSIVKWSRILPPSSMHEFKHASVDAINKLQNNGQLTQEKYNELSALCKALCPEKVLSVIG